MKNWRSQHIPGVVSAWCRESTRSVHADPGRPTSRRAQRQLSAAQSSRSRAHSQHPAPAVEAGSWLECMSPAYHTRTHTDVVRGCKQFKTVLHSCLFRNSQNTPPTYRVSKNGAVAFDGLQAGTKLPHFSIRQCCFVLKTHVKSILINFITSTVATKVNNLDFRL